MTYQYEYPHPAVTVDCVVFGLDLADENLKVLLIQRDIAPFQGQWALPGGHVHQDEQLQAAALRELQEETGMTEIYLEQLYTYGQPGRDPRGWVISVAYYALVKMTNWQLQAATDARDVAWFSIHDLPDLAFDHNKIFEAAYNRLQGKISYQPVGFELLPEKFTLTQLQKLYEIILDTRLDKRNFRKKILAMDLLADLNEIEKDVAHRAARLYRFDKDKYQALTRQGFNFSL